MSLLSLYALIDYTHELLFLGYFLLLSIIVGHLFALSFAFRITFRFNDSTNIAQTQLDSHTESI